MAEETIEKTDSQIVADAPQDTGEVELTVDDYNVVKAELESEKAKNSKLYARLKKTETSKPLEKVLIKESPELSQEFAILKLKVDHGIKDPAAIEFLMKNGGEEALKNPYIKSTIDTMIAQKANEAAQVAEENQKSDFQRKMTLGQLKALPTSEEMEKVLPHA